MFKATLLDMTSCFINCDSVNIFTNIAGTANDGRNTIIVYHGSRCGGERGGVNRVASTGMGSAEKPLEEGEIDEDSADEHYLAGMTRALGVMKNAMACMNRDIGGMMDQRSYYRRDQHSFDEQRYNAAMARMNRGTFGSMEKQNSYYRRDQHHFYAPYSGIPCHDCSHVIPGYVMPYYGQEHFAPEPHPHYNHFAPPIYAPQHYEMYPPQHHEEYDEYDERSPMWHDINSDEEEFLDEGCLGFRYDEEDYNVPSSPQQHNPAPPSPFEAAKAMSPDHDHMEDSYDQIPILNVYD